MIRLPSLQRSFDAYFTGDDALEQPPAPLSADATPEDHEAYKAAHETYRAKLIAAWDTGDWSALLLPGKTPTKFVLAQVDREIWRSIMERNILPDTNKQHIGDQRMYSLLFRLALVGVVGIDGLSVSRAPDEEWNGWTMASRSVVTALDSAAMQIVSEIGAGIYRKLWAGVSGKSLRG